MTPESSVVAETILAFHSTSALMTRYRMPRSPGENDHDAVRRVGEMITSKVTTIPCMVDRICTGRQIGTLTENF